ncbi:polysaccharide biosynthesis/export family protein [Neolewinella antarctica]|uniref:Polysaccharide export outer membrane protein n=1 Tax=Neolewinella antarctica TaxID=442734 RepID=A0ABX0XAA4_9BACT|nr:polysaccharide biosynthesis/export family protein [Neolewinella antarctica]NJC25888.1 polysaccharide export outer membrane protein [Neolewinella antarctica]
MKFFSLLVLGVVCLLTACVPHRELVNYQRDIPAATSQSIDNLPEIKIQANDVLSIEVFGPDEKIIAPFVNKSTTSANIIDVEAIQLGGYLVSDRGNIFFPQVGGVPVEGKTIVQVREMMVGLLEKFMKDPVVNVRLLSFRVTVSGEVNREGSFSIFNDRISIPEAIARAGGLSDYANRRNILLVRETNGQRYYERFDLTSADVFSSEYFYLKQNDLLYVEPIRAKGGAIRDQTSKTVPIITAVATILAVIINLTQN